MQLTKGLTKISGPNGSGKTTVFRALIYGLTGWCDPSWGTQSELQKDDEVVPGYVELDITVNGEAYKLIRYTLVTAKTPDRITKDNTLVVEKRQRVNAWLEQYIDVPVTVLAQLMWLRQEQASWLLTATASSINTFLGIIFDTKRLEKLRDGIKKSIDRIATIRDDFDSRTNLAKSSIESLQDENEIQEKLTKINADIVAVTKELSKANAGMTLEEKQDEKAKIEARKAALQAALDANEALVEPSEKEPDDKLLNDLHASILDMTSLQTEYKQRVDSMLVTENRLSAGIAEIEAIEDWKCAYCGAAVQDKDSYMAMQYAVLLKSIGAEGYTELKDSYVLSEVKDEAHHLLCQLKLDQRTYFDTIGENGKQLRQWKEDLRKLKDLQSQWKAYRQEKEHHIPILTDLQACDARLKQLEETPVIEQSANTLASNLNKLNLEQERISNYLYDVKSKKALADFIIKEAEQDRLNYNTNRKAKLVLTTLRECLSQSRAQARYINCKIDLLNQYINNFLLMSEMPFVLELDKEEHLFRYHMADSEVWHPAGMLSGAQKAAASIAIQMALLRVAVNDVTLLLIDEADASLDLSNKFIAARLYKDISQSFSSVEGSVLIISQSEEIANICDREVDVCLR